MTAAAPARTRSLPAAGTRPLPPVQVAPVTYWIVRQWDAGTGKFSRYAGTARLVPLQTRGLNMTVRKP